MSGIPLETLNREVAPNQFEFTPLYGNDTTEIDQNIMAMQITRKSPPSPKAQQLVIATRDGINLLTTHKELLLLDQHSNLPVPSSFQEYE